MKSVLKEAGHIKNTAILIFQHIQCLHLMCSFEVAWVLVSSNSSSAANNTHSRLTSKLSISYDYVLINLQCLFLLHFCSLNVNWTLHYPLRTNVKNLWNCLIKHISNFIKKTGLDFQQMHWETNKYAWRLH